MNRREFLKASSIALLVSIAASSGAARLLMVPVQAEYRGKLYRGTRDGKIYVSQTAGKTWQMHTNLGSHCPVVRLQASADGNLYSQMSVQGHPFMLALTKDGKSWRTVA